MELSFANIAFVVLGLVGIKWLARAWLALGQALHEIQCVFTLSTYLIFLSSVSFLIGAAGNP